MATVDADVLVTVEVTEEDIRQGERGVCTYCPVALAMARAVGKPVDVSAYGYGDLFGEWSRDLPEVALNFVAAFDDGEPVAPFTFDASFPESFLAK